MVNNPIGVNDDACVLRALLQSHLDANKLVPNPQRRINRLHYMAVANLKASPEVDSVFDELDEIVRTRLEITETDIAAIRDYTEQAFQERTLALASGRVNKRRIERRFGYPKKAFDKEPLSTFFDQWDARVGGVHYIPDTRKITAEDNTLILNPPKPRSPFAATRAPIPEGTESFHTILSRALEEDYVNDCIPLNRYGRILRKAYADRFGVTKWALVHYRYLFEGIERRFRDLQSRCVALLPEIKAWFLEEMENGTLELNGGKVVLLKIAEQFDVSYATLTRTTAARDLIDWMNDEILRRQYVQGKDVGRANRLAKALTAAELNVDGLTINQTALQNTGAFTFQDLRLPDSQKAIKAFEEQLRKQVVSDPLKAIINRRLQDFSHFVEAGWPSYLAVTIRNLFLINFEFSPPYEVYGVKTALSILLGHLSARATHASKVSFNAICQRTDVPIEVWRQVILEVQADLRGRYTNWGYRKTRASFLNRVIDVYADGGFLPSNEFKVSAGDGKKSRGRRSLGELVAANAGLENAYERPAETSATAGGAQAVSVPSDYVTFARWVLMQRETEDSDEPTSELFLEVLEQEFARQASSLPSDPVDAIVYIIKRRLGLVHAAASRLFEKWHDHFERGQVLAKIGKDSSAYVATLFGDRHHKNYPASLEEFYPVRRNIEQATANLLRLVLDRHAGLLPKTGTGQDPFFQKRVKKISSIEEFQAYLTPHNDAVGAAITMYMVESGANNAVSRTLFENAVEDTDELGYIKITGEKARAVGRPIYVNLHRTSQALQSIEWLRQNSTLVRQAAPEDERQMLFLMRAKGRVRHPTADWLYVWFNRLIGSIPELKELGITSAMIRTSVILLDALTTQGDLRMGLARAQHDPATTSVYQIQGPTRFIYDRRFAQFQLEADRLVREIADGTLSPALKPTGTGGVCAVGGCPEMKCWDSCRNFALIAEPHFLADIQIWGEGLRHSQSEWERDRPERWNAVWLPHLIFTEQLVEKFQSAELSLSLKKHWKRGSAIAAERKARPDFQFPRLH